MIRYRMQGKEVRCEKVLKDWKKEKGGREKYWKKKDIRNYVEPRKKRKVRDGKKKWRQRRNENE